MKVFKNRYCCGMSYFIIHPQMFKYPKPCALQT